MGLLTEKIRQFKSDRSAKHNGLERLLDIRALEETEYLIFCRKVSLLQAKIELHLDSRSPDQAVRALLMSIKTSFCSSCLAPYTYDLISKPRCKCE